MCRKWIIVKCAPVLVQIAVDHTTASVPYCDQSRAVDAHKPTRAVALVAMGIERSEVARAAILAWVLNDARVSFFTV